MKDLKIGVCPILDMSPWVSNWYSYGVCLLATKIFFGINNVIRLSIVYRCPRVPWDCVLVLGFSLFTLSVNQYNALQNLPIEYSLEIIVAWFPLGYRYVEPLLMSTPTTRTSGTPTFLPNWWRVSWKFLFSSWINWVVCLIRYEKLQHCIFSYRFS